MAKISGWIFLIIGIVLSGTSFYINYSQKINSMTIFLYLGYLFIAYGAAKIIIKFIMNKDPNDKNNKLRLPEAENQDKNTKPRNLHDEMNRANQNRINHNTVKNSPSNQNNNTNQDFNPNGYIGYCERCGTPMRRINTYCHRCGMKQ